MFRKELSLLGTLIYPNTFEEAVQTVSGMCGGSKNDMTENDYLDIARLGIKLFDLKEYKEALDTLKRGEISKVMFQITPNGK